MRKRIVTSFEPKRTAVKAGWLDLETLAVVEVTSEDPAHPIEAAFSTEDSFGWQASVPGQQVVRLLFDQPQVLHRICLEFNEPSMERTQEYLLRWSGDGGQSFHDIVRQQWNFSSPAATRETEDHRVNLPGVTVLELVIVPDITERQMCASLTHLRLA